MSERSATTGSVGSGRSPRRRSRQVVPSVRQISPSATTAGVDRSLHLVVLSGGALSRPGHSIGYEWRLKRAAITPTCPGAHLDDDQIANEPSVPSRDRNGRTADRRRQVRGEGCARRTGDRGGRRVRRRTRRRQCCPEMALRGAQGPRREVDRGRHAVRRQRPLARHVRPDQARRPRVRGDRLVGSPGDMAARHRTQDRRRRRCRRRADGRREDRRQPARTSTHRPT